MKKSHDNKDEDEKEDDSKMNILKKDEGLGLSLKKKKKSSMVQFKEQSIKEINEENINDSLNSNNFPFKHKFQDIMSSSNFTPGEQDTIRSLNQKEKEKDDKFNQKNKIKNNVMTKEDIEKKMINMIYSNLNAKILLNIGLFVFCVIYITSFVIYCLLDQNLEKARNFAFYYFEKTSLMNEIILNYQIHLIKNIHDESLIDKNAEISLEELIQYYKINSDQLIEFNNEHNINSILKDTSELITIISGKTFCENFAKFYIKNFPKKNIIEEDLKNECLIVGEKMNINGYTDAQSYSFTTISVYVDDWKNIYNFNNKMDKEDIKEKLNENKLINVIEEMIFTSSKFSDVLTLCLFNDFDNIFDKIKTFETLFGLISIILEILFFVVSILIIIYPIRSVDIVIDWFSKKYGNS